MVSLGHAIPESLFDVFYLITVLAMGIKFLSHKNQQTNTKAKNLAFYFGISTLLLGIGDFTHLVPRVINFWASNEFLEKNEIQYYLSLGKLISSLTMTFFYIVMQRIICISFKLKKNTMIETVVFVLSIIRIFLCLYPLNQWFSQINNFDAQSKYQIASANLRRNIPFFFMGAIIVTEFYLGSKYSPLHEFKGVWVMILFSFLFYAIVVVFAPFYRAFGAFMIPKTICYLLIIRSFNNNLVLFNSSKKK